MEENGFKNGHEFFEPTNRTGDAFHYICRVGNVEELLEALETLRCRDVLFQHDFGGRQPIHAVAECDQANAISKIEVLLIMGADINAKELVMGNTLLHIAVSTKNYLLAEWICKKPDANLRAINFQHKTAYQVACRIGDLRMMELLRTNGAVCDDPDDTIETID